MGLSRAAKFVLRKAWRVCRKAWYIWTLVFGPLLVLDILFLTATSSPVFFVHTSWSPWLWLTMLPWAVWVTRMGWQRRLG